MGWRIKGSMALLVCLELIAGLGVGRDYQVRP